MDGKMRYRFTVQWGEERDTDDAEGRVVQSSDARPNEAEIRAALPAFTGTIEQIPPRFSAIKVAGERAYDLARDDEAFDLAARPVQIDRLDLVERPDAGHAVFEAACGKGTYVRAIARDLGRKLGCFGHVCALRRLSVGALSEKAMISLAHLEAMCQKAAAGEGNLADALLPVETALDDIPALADQLEQPAAGMIVLAVGLEVLGQIVDALGEDRHLNFGRAGVAGLVGVRLDDFSLAAARNRHRSVFLSRSGAPNEPGQVEHALGDDFAAIHFGTSL
jgi:tRNA pseudouridine(55) synthase